MANETWLMDKDFFYQQKARADMAFAILEYFLSAKRKYNSDEPDILVPQEVITLEITAAQVLQKFLSPDENDVVRTEARLITAEDRAKLH